MKYCTILILLLCRIPLLSQDAGKIFQHKFEVVVGNPLQQPRHHVLVHIPAGELEKLVPDFNAKAFAVYDHGREIASQYNLQDVDHHGIVTVLEMLQAGEQRTLEVWYNGSGAQVREYAKRTQAEVSSKTGGRFENRKYIGGAFANTDYLRVPAEHKDHSYYIRYEGPGWESDRVGYRFYLDQRNAVDVFGKKTQALVLQDIGQDGFESYHAMQPWGMDVMKVGNSLGLGSIGALQQGTVVRVEKTDSVDCRIAENGPVFSSIITRYFGWKVGANTHNVVSRLSIHAGTRLTHERLDVTGNAALCTGIVKDKAATLITDPGNNKRWAYLATYGKQSLHGDELGLVIFVNPNDLESFSTDNNSNLITFKPGKHTIDYYFAACWAQEPEGIRDDRQFRDYLNQVAESLAHPVTVRLKKSKK